MFSYAVRCRTAGAVSYPSTLTPLALTWTRSPAACFSAHAAMRPSHSRIASPQRSSTRAAPRQGFKQTPRGAAQASSNSGSKSDSSNNSTAVSSSNTTTSNSSKASRSTPSSFPHSHNPRALHERSANLQAARTARRMEKLSEQKQRGETATTNNSKTARIRQHWERQAAMHGEYNAISKKYFNAVFPTKSTLQPQSTTYTNPPVTRSPFSPTTTSAHATPVQQFIERTQNKMKPHGSFESYRDELLYSTADMNVNLSKKQQLSQLNESLTQSKLVQLEVLMRAAERKSYAVEAVEQAYDYLLTDAVKVADLAHWNEMIKLLSHLPTTTLMGECFAALLQAKRKPDQRTLLNLMRAYATHENTSALHTTFTELQTKHKVIPTIRHYEVLLQDACRTDDTAAIQRWLTEIANKHLTMSIQLYDTLLSYYVANHPVERVRALYEQISAKDETFVHPLCHHVFDAFKVAAQKASAHATPSPVFDHTFSPVTLFQTMQQHKFTPSPALLSAYILYLGSTIPRTVAYNVGDLCTACMNAYEQVYGVRADDMIVRACIQVYSTRSPAVTLKLSAPKQQFMTAEQVEKVAELTGRLKMAAGPGLDIKTRVVIMNIYAQQGDIDTLMATFKDTLRARVEALNNGVQHYADNSIGTAASDSARIPFDEDNVEQLQRISSAVSHPPASYFLPVLMTLVKSRNMKSLYTFWKELKATCQLSREVYDAFIVAHIQSGQFRHLLEIMKEMKQLHKMEPNIHEYNALIGALSVRGETKSCLQVWETLKLLQIHPTKTTFRLLIEACGNANYMAELEDIWGVLKQTLTEPVTADLYAAKVTALAKNKMYHQVFGVLSEMRLASTDLTLNVVLALTNQLSLDGEYKVIKKVAGVLQKQLLAEYVENEKQQRQQLLTASTPPTATTITRFSTAHVTRPNASLPRTSVIDEALNEQIQDDHTISSSLLSKFQHLCIRLQAALPPLYASLPNVPQLSTVLMQKRFNAAQQQQNLLGGMDATASADGASLLPDMLPEGDMNTERPAPDNVPIHLQFRDYLRSQLGGTGATEGDDANNIADSYSLASTIPSPADATLNIDQQLQADFEQRHASGLQKGFQYVEPAVIPLSPQQAEEAQQQAVEIEAMESLMNGFNERLNSKIDIVKRNIVTAHHRMLVAERKREKLLTAVTDGGAGAMPLIAEGSVREISEAAAASFEAGEDTEEWAEDAELDEEFEYDEELAAEEAEVNAEEVEAEMDSDVAEAPAAAVITDEVTEEDALTLIEQEANSLLARAESLSPVEIDKIVDLYRVWEPPTDPELLSSRRMEKLAAESEQEKQAALAKAASMLIAENYNAPVSPLSADTPPLPTLDAEDTAESSAALRRVWSKQRREALEDFIERVRTDPPDEEWRAVVTHNVPLGTEMPPVTDVRNEFTTAAACNIAAATCTAVDTATSSAEFPSHPVMFDTHDLCSLHSNNRLSVLTIAQLKQIQAALIGSKPKQATLKSHHISFVAEWLKQCPACNSGDAKSGHQH